MNKLTVQDLPIKGKKVLMRVDFNVPLDNQQNVSDPTRIEASLPTIRYILEKGGSVILMSHLGRPHHVPDPDLSLAPCQRVLTALLGQEVKMAPDCIGSKVNAMASALQPGEVLLLENLRFHRAEEFPEEDPNFAKELASLGELYVNDAFGTAHREHSSTTTITKYFPGKAAAGLLMAKELHFLGEILSNPKRPFYALIGGAKISTKINVIKSLLKKVDALLIGGGMAFTFLKAQGMDIGNSLCEEKLLPIAKQIIENYKNQNIPLLLPVDIVAANECSEDARSQIVDMSQGIPPGYQGLDIGPKTVALFSETLKKARTILWNGPVGVYEFEPFEKGTEAIVQAIAASGSVSIAGGGDSIAALNAAGLADKITHISTGGGATLEFIETGTLPGIEALSEGLKMKIAD